MTTENKNNHRNNIYPLKNIPLYLQFSTVPGAEVLGLSLVSENEALRIPVGNYSVQAGIWHHRNETISLSSALLDEILILAKSYALARAAHFGNLKTYANSAPSASNFKE